MRMIQIVFIHFIFYSNVTLKYFANEPATQLWYFPKVSVGFKLFVCVSVLFVVVGSGGCDLSRAGRCMKCQIVSQTTEQNWVTKVNHPVSLTQKESVSEESRQAREKEERNNVRDKRAAEREATNVEAEAKTKRIEADIEAEKIKAEAKR